MYHFFRQLWLVLGVKLMEITPTCFPGNPKKSNHHGKSNPFGTLGTHCSLGPGPKIMAPPLPQPKTKRGQLSHGKNLLTFHHTGRWIQDPYIYNSLLMFIVIPIWLCRISSPIYPKQRRLLIQRRVAWK